MMLPLRWANVELAIGSRTEVAEESADVPRLGVISERLAPMGFSPAAAGFHIRRVARDRGIPESNIRGPGAGSHT